MKELLQARGLKVDARTDIWSLGAIDSIVVLPLVNTSGDPNTDICLMASRRTLINSRIRLQQLRVVASTTAFRYKGT